MMTMIIKAVISGCRAVISGWRASTVACTVDTCSGVAGAGAGAGAAVTPMAVEEQLSQ